MIETINKIARIIMLLLGFFMLIIGIVHFIAPKWYHDFYPGFDYNQNDIFDREAVKTIGLWAIMCSVLAFWATLYWKKSKVLIIFLAFICFSFVLAQINSFIQGYFPWYFALLFIFFGILFLLAKGLEKKLD